MTTTSKQKAVTLPETMPAFVQIAVYTGKKSIDLLGNPRLQCTLNTLRENWQRHQQAGKISIQTISNYTYLLLTDKHMLDDAVLLVNRIAAQKLTFTVSKLVLTYRLHPTNGNHVSKIIKSDLDWTALNRAGRITEDPDRDQIIFNIATMRDYHNMVRVIKMLKSKGNFEFSRPARENAAIPRNNIRYHSADQALRVLVENEGTFKPFSATQPTRRTELKMVS